MQLRRPVRPSALHPAALLAALLSAPLARAAADPGWPRQLTSGADTITLYEPQPESLKDNTLSSRAAFSVRTSGSEPAFGALWLVGKLDIDRDARTVRSLGAKVTRIRLPGAEAAREQALQDALNQEVAAWTGGQGSLDRLMTSLESEDRARASVADLKNEPPAIVFVDQPTVLVLFDGEPVLRPLDDGPLERAVNTPMLVVRDSRTSRCYLSGGRSWYAAEAALGPWSPVARVPPEVQKLVPAEAARKAGQGGDDAAPEGAAALEAAPRIQTATTPTELIATSGAPDWQPLPGGELLYLTNTESDVLKELSTQSLWVLLGGRWFKASSERGPWTFVRGDELPASFARIPPESPRGNLLAFVAGTDEAQDAVMDAQIPQTAAVKRSAVAPLLTYDGAPAFEAINADVQVARNTPQSVLKIGARYYLCQDGVWWVSDRPDGGWVVADTVPEQVQTIPPSSPVYNARYVQVYEATPEVVYVGYTPGYLWSFPYYGAVVYGTGWFYRPWLGPRFYYPRPCWWGFHVHYNPWWGWSFGFSANVGFLRAGVGFGPHRGWGGHGWYGPGGWRRPVVTNHYTEVDHRGGPRPLARAVARNLYSRPSAASYVAHTRANPSGRGPRAGRGPNDAVTDRSGNVYRRGPDGWRSLRPAEARPFAKGERGSPEWTEHARSRAASRERFYRSGGFGGGGHRPAATRPWGGRPGGGGHASTGPVPSRGGGHGGGHRGKR